MKKMLLLFLLFVFNSGFTQQYVNGNLSTGNVSNNGTIAPAGYTWAELQSNSNEPTITNIQQFYPMNSGMFKSKFSDDFIVPFGQIWNITSMEFFVIIPLNSTAPFPVSELRIEIWNGDPSLVTSTRLYGDLSTNVLDLANSGNAFMYAIDNSNFVTTCNSNTVNGTMSKVWKVRGTVNTSLNSGTYWIVFQPLRLGTLEIAVPLNRYIGSRGMPINNGARAYIGTEFNWYNVLDAGCPTSALDIFQDFPFIINYTLTLSNSEVVQNKSIKLYPNPVKNNFTIEMENGLQSNSIKTLTLFDVRGLKVFETKINNSIENTFSFDVSQLNKGIYFVKLMDGLQEVYATKVIKE